MTVLSTDDLHDWLREHPAWEQHDGVIKRRLEFPDFASALARANQVGVLAERADHHPDLSLGWGRLEIELTTHSAGGLTRKDLELADQIDELG